MSDTDRQQDKSRTYLLDVIEESSHLDAVRLTVGLLACTCVGQQHQMLPEEAIKNGGGDGGHGVGGEARRCDLCGGEKGKMMAMD
jgi:hypothetical protein